MLPNDYFKYIDHVMEELELKTTPEDTKNKAKKPTKSALELQGEIYDDSGTSKGSNKRIKTIPRRRIKKGKIESSGNSHSMLQDIDVETVNFTSSNNEPAKKAVMVEKEVQCMGENKPTRVFIDRSCSAKSLERES